MSSVQFSGLASGIDSGALIDSLVEARQVRNDIRRKQITDIKAESESLSELKSKLSSLSDLLDKFRTSNGGGVSKRASTSDPSVVTATTSATAINAAYTVNVTSVANAGTGSFDKSYSGLDSVVSAVGGNITISMGTGSEEVIITESIGAGTTTLSDYINSFNNREETAGRVVASAVNIGTDDAPDYRLMFTSLETGTSKGNLDISSSAGDMGSATIAQATNAVFSIAGIGTSITRSTNTVSDVISGVSFSIVDQGQSVVTVTNDADKTFSEMQEFVDAYNETVKFINDNNKIERVETERTVTNVYGSLAKARVAQDFLSSFRGQLSSATSTSGLEVKSLSQMGFITNRDGTITLKEDEFKDAVKKDVLGATETLNNFADKVAGVNGTIYQYTKFNGLIDISTESNNSQIENIARAIAQLDRQTDKIRDGLTRRFSNLESVVGRLQSQQQALTGILTGLG